MVVIGACVAPSTDQHAKAKVWFECVEEMVFGDEDFCFEASALGSQNSDHQSQKCMVEAIQAAYIVCLYQNWEGGDASRRRIRRYRFSNLVSIVRDTIAGTSESERNDETSLDSSFNWIDFTLREELTRTFLWIFLLDTCFVIFNNLPPRMVTKELRMRMASPESCFQAETAEDCAEAFREWTSHTSQEVRVSLHEAIQIFCSGDLSPSSCNGFAKLGPLNLFVMISAFHILIFQRMNSFGDDGNLGAIHNALHNWRAVWELYVHKYSTEPPHAMVECNSTRLHLHDMWRRVGFTRHAHEFWLLANLLTQRMDHNLVRRSDHLEQGPHDRGVDMDPVLSEFDQNNMQQVNELIASFENARIM
ncbi:hypothetical protein E8E12_003778 [Didymella heteroderae]|uniref:Transcription factor domain-containing protein n=1 Tax=Didymella heteroderae TaxID=1769908 RepID=A0A9P4X0W6_9PLEO|nr:hypothetical protein E8E12_003778 [Didymella heteroderae]